MGQRTWRWHVDAQNAKRVQETIVDDVAPLLVWRCRSSRSWKVWREYMLRIWDTMHMFKSGA
jgi:hypothetical protein